MARRGRDDPRGEPWLRGDAGQDGTAPRASSGPLQFAFNDAVLDVPAAVQQYAGVAYVSSDPNPVLASVALDRKTGVVTWRMQSVDPLTGWLPEDPLRGLPAPERRATPGRGLRQLQRPAAGQCAVRSRAHDQASIVFDVNAPIVTPVAVNRLDATRRRARVSLRGTQEGNVWLAWSGADGGGSGIVAYDVFVSRTADPMPCGNAARPRRRPPSLPARLEPHLLLDGRGCSRKPRSRPRCCGVQVQVLVLLRVTRALPVTLEWATAPGVAYAVERTSTLGPDAEWTVVGGPIIGVEGMASFTDPQTEPPTTGAAFYRVRGLNP